MTEQEKLAARLRELREHLGYSQQQVADHLGLHRPAVSEIEAGRRGVASLELVKLAKLYHCDTAYLLGEDSPIPSAGLAGIVAGLADQDRREVVRFAQFLAWRKKAKEEDECP